MSAVLQIKGAHKQFKKTTALDGMDLSLGKGEWLGLLGPNGAGKTTLIRSIAGRVRLDRGSIHIEGKEIQKPSSSKYLFSKLGVVSQTIALYPLLTAQENLQVWGSFSGLSDEKLQEKVDWALVWTGLHERKDDKVKTYSGGMQRRLNIACSVLHDPEIILLDEPTVGVDPQSRERIWEMLEGLHKKEASLLLTTHQLDEAQKVCERVVIIDRGRKIAQGTFEELLEQTIGMAHIITFHVDGEPPESLTGDGFTIKNNQTVEYKLENITENLDTAIKKVAASGLKIEQLTVKTPTLQDVFIDLTGRELRE